MVSYKKYMYSVNVYTLYARMYIPPGGGILIIFLPGRHVALLLILQGKSMVPE